MKAASRSCRDISFREYSPESRKALCVGRGGETEGCVGSNKKSCARDGVAVMAVLGVSRGNRFMVGKQWKEDCG